MVRDRATDHYQPQFDGLRAMAVITVMVDHFTADVPNFPLPDWIHLGATGVRLFLVMSGYFITTSLRRARYEASHGLTWFQGCAVAALIGGLFLTQLPRGVTS